MKLVSLLVAILVSTAPYEAGGTLVFPDIDEDDFPAQTLSVQQSPGGTMYWVMGQLGEVKQVGCRLWFSSERNCPASVKQNGAPQL